MSDRTKRVREMTSTADRLPGSPRRPRNLGRILPRARHPRVWARSLPPDAIGRRHETSLFPKQQSHFPKERR